MNSPSPERPATPGAPAPVAPAAPPGPVRRRGLFRWILLPLLVAGVGFAGYRLGQSSPTTGQSAGAGGMGGRAADMGSGAGGANARSTSDRNTRNPAAAGGAAGGDTSTPAGQWNRRGATGGSQDSSDQTRRSQSGSSQRSGAARENSGSAGGQAPAAGTAGRGAGRLSGGVVTPVSASEVKAGTLTTQRRLSGTVSATQSTTVNSRVSGVVSRVNAGVGDRVVAGQEIVVVSSPDLQSAVQTAESNLESAQQTLRSRQRALVTGRVSLQQAITSAQNNLNNAQKQLKTLQQLYGVGAVARSEVDAQQVTVSNAQAALLSAQNNLTQGAQGAQEDVQAAQLGVQKAQIALQQAQRDAGVTRVTAPYGGTLNAVNVSAGESVGSGTPVFTLVSSSLAVKVNVPVTEAASLPAGTEMKFVVGQQTYPLKVAQVGGGTGGSVPVTARFTGEALPAGGTVGSVVYTAKVGQGILLPSTALQADNDRTYVFVIQAGKAQRTEVTVLGQAGAQSVVQGLQAGMEVITQPPSGLVSGSSVTTRNAGQPGGAGPGNAGQPGNAGAGGPPPGAP